jgi:hypothetical protein
MNKRSGSSKKLRILTQPAPCPFKGTGYNQIETTLTIESALPLRLPILALLSVALMSCGGTPQIGDGPTATDRSAKYPTLLPLSTLIAIHSTSSRNGVQIGGLAGLNARAEALRAPVLDTQTRTKLLDAIKRHRAL